MQLLRQEIFKIFSNYLFITQEFATLSIIQLEVLENISYYAYISYCQTKIPEALNSNMYFINTARNIKRKLNVISNFKAIFNIFFEQLRPSEMSVKIYVKYCFTRSTRFWCNYFVDCISLSPDKHLLPPLPLEEILASKYAYFLHHLLCGQSNNGCDSTLNYILLNCTREGGSGWATA